MKLLVWASTLDLKYGLGCTPAWLQLLKALQVAGHEVLAAPYLGTPPPSDHWRGVSNPCLIESRLYYRVSSGRSAYWSGRAGPGKALGRFLASHWVKARWERRLRAVLTRERDVDALLLMNIPVNHIQGLPGRLAQEFGLRTAYYDGDMPVALPDRAGARGLRFSYYEGADLAEFDAFLTNSEGSMPVLKEMGARNLRPLHYAADPDLLKPAGGPPDSDASFYGQGDEEREEWMRRLLAEPSLRLGHRRFIVGGGGFRSSLGRTELVGAVPFDEFASFVGRSKVAINIPRAPHATTFCSSTARPFELAAFGAAIVSAPYAGIERWFEPGKEIVVLREADDAARVLEGVLGDDEQRLRLGRNARAAILDRHTYAHRAAQLVRALGGSSSGAQPNPSRPRMARAAMV